MGGEQNGGPRVKINNVRHEHLWPHASQHPALGLLQDEKEPKKRQASTHILPEPPIRKHRVHRETIKRRVVPSPTDLALAKERLLVRQRPDAPRATLDPDPKVLQGRDAVRHRRRVGLRPDARGRGRAAAGAFVLDEGAEEGGVCVCRAEEEG